MTHRLTLPRDHRLRRRRDIDGVFRARLRASDRYLLVYARANGLGYPRQAVVVGRRHGGAVRRNRVKRLIREAFRLSQHALPGGVDYVCVPQVAADHTTARFRASLLRLAARVAGMMLRRGGVGDGEEACLR